METLRCNRCDELFPAAAPEGVGTDKCDESSTAMVGLLRYGTGLPFNRLDRLQGSLGIPLPASTQWDLVQKAADVLRPAYEELVGYGAA